MCSSSAVIINFRFKHVILFSQGGWNGWVGGAECKDWCEGIGPNSHRFELFVLRIGTTEPVQRAKWVGLGWQLDYDITIVQPLLEYYSYHRTTNCSYHLSCTLLVAATGLSYPRVARDGQLLPSARLVSTTIHWDVDKPHHIYTLLLMTVGQFIDHDISRTAVVMLETKASGE